MEVKRFSTAVFLGLFSFAALAQAPEPPMAPPHPEQVNWPSTRDEAGPKPTNYAEVIFRNLEGGIPAPITMQDFRMSEPELAHCQVAMYGTYYGWRVKVRFVTDNIFGSKNFGERYYWFNGEQLWFVNRNPDFCPEASGWSEPQGGGGSGKGSSFER